MKKTIIGLVLICLLSFPYVFIAMYLDCSNGSMIGYGIMIVMSLIVGFTSRYSAPLLVLVVGNLLSYAISYYLNTTMAGHERWSWYFKPLTSLQLLMLVSILNLIPQIIGIKISGNSKDNDKKAKV